MSVSSIALVSLIACSAFVTTEAGATRQLKTFQDVRDYVLKDFGVISAVYDLSRCYVPKEFAALQGKKLTSVNGRQRIPSARNNWDWGLPPNPNYWQYHAPPVTQRFGPWRPRFRRSAANLYRNKIYVEHLNDVWLWVRLTSRAEELRATDVFVEDRWIFVQPKLYDRGEAILNIVDLSGGEIGLISNFTAVCKIGEGAQFFAQDPGVAKEEFNTYEDMKGAVRTGKELIARALTTECPGPSWEPFGIADFVAAYKVYAARIENEGTDEEKLVFNFYLFSDQFQAFAASPVALETVAYTMKPDGSAEVALGPIDLTTFKIPFKPIYNCTIGKTFFLGAIASDRNVRKYNTYEDVLHAAKAGQTINTIMDARLCNWKGGRRPDATEINMRRFSPWVHATEKPQYGNFIGFFDLNYNNIPTKMMEKYWVFDNDTVLYEILTIDPERKTQVLQSATCTMGCSIKFGSSERPREEILCADGLRAALLRGEYVTYMLDYDRCAGPEYVFDSHGGGLLEHAEIDPMTGIVHSTGKAIATFLTSGEAVRVQQPVTVHPDGTVVVVAETRVTDTTFRKIGETATFTCKIGESAFFFA